MTTRTLAWGLALLFWLPHGATQAQNQAQAAPGCDAVAPIGSRLINRTTQAAMDAADQLITDAGAGADLRALRTTLLRDRFPSADVDLTLRSLLQAYCRVVQAAAGLSDADKAARIQAANTDMLAPAQGPTVVARTSSRIRRSGGPLDGPPLLLASRSDDAWLPAWLAQVQAPAAADPADAFLRDAPPFVNDSNKYFVIVGSAGSEQAAVALMNRLHRKAPQYDFVVFMPYGANPTYGVMMATWVSKEVAQQALRAARQSVVPDAYLWACRSGGDSC
ncbi:SPOR domain-containing protein [Pseudaquabacterium pictum]|uniref:SPOR domain-containing protein n=1 Tax=Pseudaquabacterium pictum TaxID=2315236 RepID=A0A480ATJ9_9BURK|nr:SPOR domain-containing protein [Rubrivivax pictus]GCL64741.1 hypothetical protein AQPW35_38220 [Rubrivivax pictus]